MAMTREQEIALAVIGGLLLLPGLCGFLYTGGVILDHLSWRRMRFIEFESLVWVIAQPSMMVGCLGLFLIGWGTRSPGLAKAAYAVSWAALAATIILAVFVIYASSLSDRGGDTGAGVFIAVCFAASFLIFVLPGLLAYRRRKKDRSGA